MNSLASVIELPFIKPMRDPSARTSDSSRTPNSARTLDSAGTVSISELFKKVSTAPKMQALHENCLVKSRAHQNEAHVMPE